MSANKQRADGQTTLTVSLSEELKAAWEQEAARQRRSKSNLFSLVAEKYLSGALQETPDDQGKIIDPAQGNATGVRPADPVSYRMSKQA